jgi:glutamate synthase domain-containing protein 2
LLKIMSKMGVSTIRSYRGAQIFESVGLNTEFVDRFFPGTSTKIEGIGLETVAEETLRRHSSAFAKRAVTLDALDSGGSIHLRFDSARHNINASVVNLIHKAVRTGDYESYKQYAAVADDQATNLCTLRGLFKFRNRKPVPLEQVESEKNIVKRFVSGAMSFGSISTEAHEAIAIAMNRLGAASNSGEGGEDESRYQPLPNGDLKKSMVKQVASGRFGVTSHYLVNAAELQIRWPRGPSPAKAGSCPDTRWTRSSPGCGIQPRV